MPTAPRPPSPATLEAHAALLRAIRSERFHPGEQIGTERGLAEQLGIGRTILRQAIELLEQEGLVRKSIGRTGGLYFHDGRIQRHINTVQGVPDMVRQQGSVVRTTVLRSELATAYPDERRALRLGEDDRVMQVRRLREVDGVPWSLDESTLPAARFPGLLARDLSQSLYLTLSHDFGLELDHADETIEAVPADAEQAALLHIEVGATLLGIRRIAYDVAGVPIEFAYDRFRADRTRVHMQKFGSNWKRSQRRERETEA